jgi:hypothetical protein
MPNARGLHFHRFGITLPATWRWPGSAATPSLARFGRDDALARLGRDDALARFGRDAVAVEILGPAGKSVKGNPA